MTVDPLPDHHGDPLDPQGILADLPEDERDIFLSQYWRDREAAENGTGRGVPLKEVIREYRWRQAS